MVYGVCRGKAPKRLGAVLYQIFIQRQQPITLEEWKAALAQVDGVRLVSQAFTVGATNENQVVLWHPQEGDAEVYNHEYSQWIFAFRWEHDGRIRMIGSKFN